MNLFQLVLKQMRQRALSTWLTLLSVMLGVGLAIAILVFQREGAKLFGQSDFGYDLIVGPKGSGLQLVLNTVYHLDVSQGLIPYQIYADFMPREHAAPRPGGGLIRPNSYVRAAWPIAVGDEYKGVRVVGTVSQFFPTDWEGKAYDAARVFQYRADRMFEFAEGRPFHPQKFEAVVGAEAAERTGLKMGDQIKVQHGAGPGASAGKPDEHDERWTVVGILKPTHTASDRAIYIPIVSFYAIPKHEDSLEVQNLVRLGFDPQQAERLLRAQKAAAATRPAKEEDHDGASPATGPAAASAPATGPAHDEHAEGDEEHHHEHAYHLNADGTIELHLPREKWQVSAIIVRTRGGFQSQTLIYRFRNSTDAMAVSPAMVMADFFNTVLKGSSMLLLAISVLVTVVAAVSILVSIYNSVSARLREIAILRALGATRQRVLLLICLEAGLIGLIGGIVGLLAGHLLAGATSVVIERMFGEGIRWIATGWYEWGQVNLEVNLILVRFLDFSRVH